MLQRVVFGQTRFNLPGLAADARGVVVGRQLAARFAAIDRLVAFLRLLSAEQSIDDLQPGLRIVYARGGAGTREAIVQMPIVSPGLADVVAHAARLAGGQTFTGTGKQFVQYRDARAPFGYDVAALADVAGDLVLHGTEQMVPYRIESEMPLAKLLLRLSLVRAARRGAGASFSDGPIYVTARRGLGPMLSAYLHRAAVAAPAGGGELRASAALCEGATASAFANAESFWLFRVERLPARMHGLLTRTPGLDVFVPVTDNVAVAAGYRHPIHLGSCRGSFPPDRLHLFSPGGVTEVAPLPVLAAIEDVVRVRAPEARAATASPRARPELALSLRLEAGGASSGPTVAALIPWKRVPWLQRLCYALPTSALRNYRVAPLERGVLVRASEVLEGIPFGTLFELAAPDVLVPVGMRLVPAVSPALLVDRLGATGGATVVFPERTGAPFRVPAEALVPLELRVVGALAPPIDDTMVNRPRAESVTDPVEIENRPMGPMPLWGLRGSGSEG
ncbi:MAG TPA: hypothetical protein VKQ32_21515 [Polyangia bacterium]|nr:hypothetical protein [Polyangia bacterium]